MRYDGAVKELNEIVAENLVALRKGRKLTQQELADALHYSDKSISKWELGKAIPTVDILKAFADYYGVTVDFLLTEGQASAKILREKPNPNRGNQIVITSMACSFVWASVAAVYVNAILTGVNLKSLWMIFIWAVPVTCFVAAAMLRFFWKRCLPVYILSSLFIWTLFGAFYIHFFCIVQPPQNIWFIFIAAIPIQVMVILFSRLK